METSCVRCVRSNAKREHLLLDADDAAVGSTLSVVWQPAGTAMSPILIPFTLYLAWNDAHVALQKRRRPIFFDQSPNDKPECMWLQALLKLSCDISQGISIFIAIWMVFSSTTCTELCRSAENKSCIPWGHKDFFTGPSGPSVSAQPNGWCLAIRGGGKSVANAWTDPAGATGS